LTRSFCINQIPFRKEKMTKMKEKKKKKETQITKELTRGSALPSPSELLSPPGYQIEDRLTHLIY